MAQELKQIRTSIKQLNAYYAIQMRIARKEILPKIEKFGTLPIKEATELLTQLMKEYPKPSTKTLCGHQPNSADCDACKPTTSPVVAPTGVKA